MTHLPVNTIENAPDGSRGLLESGKQRFGFVPNLHGVLASSPAALSAYNSIGEIFTELTDLNPVEQQVVLLSINYENGCTYCMAAHSMIAKGVGMDDATLEALRAATPLPDAKLEALSRVSRSVVQQGGWLTDDEVQAFFDAGWTKQHLLDVVVGASFKTLSNYTNHIADTPLDNAFAQHEWNADHVTAHG
jgi:AhpD family alkylhydroperoxidase